MFELNFTELLVVGLVAIVVVGPKELPALMRTVGGWVGKAKRIGRDFQRQLNDAVRDDELTALQKQVSELSRTTNAQIAGGLRVAPAGPQMLPLAPAATAAPSEPAEPIGAQP